MSQRLRRGTVFRFGVAAPKGHVTWIHSTGGQHCGFISKYIKVLGLRSERLTSIPAILSLAIRSIGGAVLVQTRPRHVLSDTDVSLRYASKGTIKYGPASIVYSESGHRADEDEPDNSEDDYAPSRSLATICGTPLPSSRSTSNSNSTDSSRLSLGFSQMFMGSREKVGDGRPSNTQQICFCRHALSSHNAQLSLFPPRGGIGTCIQYQSQDGLPVTGYFQLCRCGQSYSAHSAPVTVPAPLTPGAPPTHILSTPRREPIHQNSDNFFSSLPRHSIPSYTNPTPMTASLVTPYAPARIAQGHTAFGVPMAGVSMPTYNARGRTRDSRTGRVAIRQPGNPGVSMNTLIVLLPKDVKLLNFVDPTPSSTFATYRRVDRENHDLTVGDMKSMFSMSSWMFIVQSVIDTALHKCIAWMSDATEVHGDISETTGDATITLDDDFVSLKLSTFPSAEKLAVIFAIGRLCTFNSWFTNQDSVINQSSWLRTLSPVLAEVLASLPAENGSASDLPADAVNRLHITRICQSRLDTSFSEIRRTPHDRWPLVRKDFIFAALLGYPYNEFMGSQEYQYRAFKDGFDMYITSSIPFLAEILRVNLDNILQQIYHHQPTADAIESILCFKVDGDSTFRSQISPRLGTFKKAVIQYLRGIGHPLHSSFEGLDNSEAMHPNHRARRFVKVLSGIPPLDPSTRFKVVVVQNVPWDACFGGTLNPETDLIPPVAHACMRRLDVFVNAPIIKWLVSAPPTTQVDESPLGICHTAFVELGEDSFNGRLPLSS
ncbi:hypothetical protein EV702DRAFT_1204470 [Suillus placidus]|uniref:Uncharacterized protein n=1 Tax=Suillus placidus TaxID=48579 RepID=A0A9P6ZIX7_9AGAM|nr:hypothetical protein EV702DRAFT_1204470 [Suillus placidus]